MTASDIAATCSKLRAEFLDGVPPSDLAKIVACATPRHFAPKSVIAAQGDPADHLFLLTKGRARFSFTTQEGTRILLLWLAPGQLLGGAALLPKPSIYLTSSEAVGACSVLVWDRATIRRLAARYPQLLENAILTASEYLGWYCATHAALTTRSAQQRLSQVLVCLSQVIGRRVPEGVELDVTNEELAGAASITHFTASRLLSQWQRHGAISKRRGKILLHSVDRLFPSKT